MSELWQWRRTPYLVKLQVWYLTIRWSLMSLDEVLTHLQRCSWRYLLPQPVVVLSYSIYSMKSFFFPLGVSMNSVFQIKISSFYCSYGLFTHWFVNRVKVTASFLWSPKLNIFNIPVLWFIFLRFSPFPGQNGPENHRSEIILFSFKNISCSCEVHLFVFFVLFF